MEGEHDRIVIARVADCVRPSCEQQSAGSEKLVAAGPRSVRAAENVRLVRTAALEGVEQLKQMDVGFLSEALKELVGGLEPKLIPPALIPAFGAFLTDNAPSAAADAEMKEMLSDYIESSSSTPR